MCSFGHLACGHGLGCVLRFPASGVHVVHVGIVTQAVGIASEFHADFITMEKSDIIILLRAAVLIGGSVTPGVAWAAQLIDYALKQAELAAAEGTMTSEEIDNILASAKADRQVADSAWDELVRQARGTET